MISLGIQCCSALFNLRMTLSSCPSHFPPLGKLWSEMVFHLLCNWMLICSYFQLSIAGAHGLNKRTRCVSGHGKTTIKRGSDKKLGPLVLPQIRCVLCSNGILDRKQTKLNFALHANFRLAWLLDFLLICTALTCNCDQWMRAADNLQAAARTTQTRRTSCEPRPCKALSTSCFVTRQWFANLGSLIASVDAKRDLDSVVLCVVMSQ